MPPSKATLWAGRIISGLTTLSFLMDGVIRFFEPAPAVEATVKLGYPEAIIIGLGMVLTLSTVLFMIPNKAGATSFVRG